MTLEMRNIYKSFGANDVLRDIDFTVGGGEICALLGENGAGKSTLMNILGGVLPADQGKILLDGAEVRFRSPAESLDAGIAFIHQELNLVNDLAIFENMYIGRELKTKTGLLDVKTMCARCQEVFGRMGVDLEPRAMVRDLDASYKQIVEIARALLMEASIIIMDEPTTSLTDPEIERVFDMMRTLRSQGVAMVFISHKLKEVMAVCTRYTVLRDGAMVAAGDVADTNVDQLARHMVGHEVRTESLRRERELGAEVLRAENLSQGRRFADVSFSLRAGEVLGFTGLLGDGRSELFQAVFGSGGRYQGQLYLEGRPVTVKSTSQAVSLGIGYVPRDRKENGIIKDMNILENGSIVTWPRQSRQGFLDWKRVRQDFRRQAEGLRIKMGGEQEPIGSLSGGNQQKVVLAKWLNAGPKVLIFDNPTQGVDVGAKEDIYDTILGLAGQGVAVVVLSSEAQEIVRLCDRVLVLYHGRVQAELKAGEITEQEIMRLATGGGASGGQAAGEIREEAAVNG
ncbi:MAG: sugar ABC transporter ATP-binding protein [Acutalibacter sp.]|nr:sugar ABC transporter ATP-binding protein [Acutalibacter sp.]